MTPATNASGNDLPRAVARERGGQVPTAAPDQKKAPYAVYANLEQPADLAAYLREVSVREAARSLGLGIRQVWRLTKGYWPRDARRTLAAWNAYKVRTARPATSWFLRRVRPGGLIHHRGRSYTGFRVGERTGELLAVARGADGELLAVALDPPAARYRLAEVQNT